MPMVSSRGCQLKAWPGSLAPQEKPPLENKKKRSKRHADEDHASVSVMEQLRIKL